jgi:hypothetical protein
MPRSAAICMPPSRILVRNMGMSNARSKFSVALGIEAQGLCLVKPYH